jgi:ADP-ribosylation factor GTPase-activating protein 1
LQSVSKMSQMAPEIQKRIRALPGNTVCCDCDNINPQWASVSYGCLMCLECSGHHRSIGVHLSFVRSIQMDSWTPKQIEAMEKSGGNDKLVAFFKSKGIEKSLLIQKKYNSAQAKYYRERLSRWLEGKTEPPADPGMYNPETGGGDAQGAEPLPGETTDQYNARQARLREEARERMRAKFGGQGMGGSMGSMGSAPPPQDGQGLGGLLGKVGNFVQNNVIENERLRSSLGSAGTALGGAVQGIRRSATDSLEEGGTVRNILGNVGGAVGGLVNKAKGSASDMMQMDLDCSKGCAFRVEQQFDVRCAGCQCIGTRYMCTRCFRSVCPKCFENPQKAAPSTPSGMAGNNSPSVGRAFSQSSGGFNFDEDDWGDAAPAAVAPVPDLKKMQQQLGINLSAPTSNTMGTPTKVAGSPTAAGYPAAASATPVAAHKPPQPSLSAAAEPAKPKAKAKAGLPKDDDFFAEFGL